MAVSLHFPGISTKLTVPAVRAGLIPRPALMQRLERFVEYRLLLVSAPAGYGKTTLLSQWTHHSAWPVAWVSLDATDNDPIRFWSYVAMALEKIEPEIANHLIPLISKPRPEQPEYLVAALANLASGMSAPFALVLDDYHCIEAEAIHSAFAQLVDYLPERMHVILSSRSDPPLPLARWRARGQLLELRATDLRFSTAEAEALLRLMAPPGVSREETAELQEWTEGWAAGLQLAALTLQQQRLQHGAYSLRDLREDGRYLRDYLAEEVLQHQPEPVRTFLVQTAVLETLSAPLCAAVTGRPDSGELLERLYRQNLFLTPLRRGEYRYHPLFADFLQEQLRDEAGSDLPALHMRAATWYETQGRPAEAIRHLLAAGEVSEAVRLIRSTVRQHLMRGESATVLGWFRSLPEETIRSEPLFCLVFAWVLASSGQTEAALRYLDHLEATLGPVEDRDLLLGEAATVRARIAVIQGDAVQNTRYAERALALLPPEASLLRSDAYLDLAFAHKDAGNLQQAEPAFREAIRLGLETGNLRATMLSAYYLADMYQAFGRFEEAARLYQEGLGWARDARPLSALACWAHAGLGALLYEWNDLPEATTHLRQAIELGQRSGEVKVLMYARLPLAALLQAEGFPDEALAVLEVAADIANQTRIASIASQIGLARLKLWLRQGRTALAASWLQQHGLSLTAQGLSPDELIALAWFHLARSQEPHLEATRIIEVLRPRAEADSAAGLALRRVADLVVLALAHRAIDRREEAIRYMSEAVSAAEPMGLVRTFADCPVPTIAELLRQVGSRHGRSGYVERLLAAVMAPPPAVAVTVAPPAPSASEPQIEALSPREVEVLRHIANGRSNQEIADEMILALSTVKWYLRNIYDKLGVRRRTQAVARARALGLLT